MRAAARRAGCLAMQSTPWTCRRRPWEALNILDSTYATFLPQPNKSQSLGWANSFGPCGSQRAVRLALREGSRLHSISAGQLHRAWTLTRVPQQDLRCQSTQCETPLPFQITLQCVAKPFQFLTMSQLVLSPARSAGPLQKRSVCFSDTASSPLLAGSLTLQAIRT